MPQHHLEDSLDRQRDDAAPDDVAPDAGADRTDAPRLLPATRQLLLAQAALQSRGGLSSWVLFFSVDGIIGFDLGLRPAVTAGAKAGVLGGLGVSRRVGYGPSRDGRALEDWCSQLQARAKRVVELPEPQLARVEVRRRLLAHELRIHHGERRPWILRLMQRDQLDVLEPFLRAHFGRRFHGTLTRPYRLLARLAPPLVR